MSGRKRECALKQRRVISLYLAVIMSAIIHFQERTLPPHQRHSGGSTVNRLLVARQIDFCGHEQKHLTITEE